MASSEIDEFLSGPLVTWFVSCLEDPDALTNYNDLVDGVQLHSVFLQIDPEPLHDGVIPSGGNAAIRTKNLEMIVGNMKQFYEDELGHLLIRQPDIMNLGKEPESHVQEMQLLLLLLLGCAVQCPNKKKFITRIKTLNLETQLAIVDCIKQVTDNHDIVITQDCMETANMPEVFKQIKELLQERDLYREKWRGAAISELAEANASSGSGEGEDSNKITQNNLHAKAEREENHHFAVELADWKSKVRKQRQELEEKTEALLECKEELEHSKVTLTKLKQENIELMHEARTAKSYRDELDAVIERAERADRLETEVARYREKLTDIEFYKTRIEELREDNRVLMENREMLEEQLTSSRRRADKVLELEAQIIEYKQLVNDMALTQQSKIVDLENNYDTVIKEKQRIQSLLESVRRRADDLERSLEIANQKLESLRNVQANAKETETKSHDLENKLTISEKEKETALRDVLKYRELLEEKDVALDKSTNNIEVLERKVIQLEREVENSVTQISRLQEIERSSKELDSRAAIDRETLETLQSNLVAEKLNSQQLYTVLEKLGLSVEMLLTLPTSSILERIAQIPEVVECIRSSIVQETTCDCSQIMAEPQKTVPAIDATMTKSLLDALESQKKEIESLLLKLNTSQATAEQLQSEKAKLQVSVTTLQSQSTSLTTQHTALQLANSQLVAEKEELLKDRSTQQRAHSQLVNDQVILQSLHEQLNNEYENLLQEREALKATLRDAKNATRVLRETCEQLQAKNKSLQAEQETAITNIKSLNNLRGEHSKLKDDFRNLYTATEKLKLEYRNLQDDYRKTKVETNRLSLRQTELQGQLSGRDEKCSALELQISKLNQRCEMLMQMNSGLDTNRQALMDHISLLFSQYHDLLTHSLEDKQHHHLEEKMYTDKVNHLYRQKEKLEEKIMEHYRKLESCSTKKKKFGAGLMKRVKKVGSELLNKNRRSWNDDSKQSETRAWEYESGGNDSSAENESGSLENDSDASYDNQRVTVNTEVSVLEPDVLVLGHPGTRRTVYYTDDVPPPPASLSPVQKSAAPLPQALPEAIDRRSPSQDQPSNAEVPASEPRSLLIYNKVSAVINESRSMNSMPVKEEAQNDEIAGDPHTVKDPKTGNSVWYEYGCV